MGGEERCGGACRCVGGGYAWAVLCARGDYCRASYVDEKGLESRVFAQVLGRLVSSGEKLWQGQAGFARTDSGTDSTKPFCLNFYDSQIHKFALA